MDEYDVYPISGNSSVSTKLLRIFLASAIVDSNGELNISRKALSEFSEKLGKSKGFELLVTPTDDHDMNLTLEWY